MTIPPMELARPNRKVVIVASAPSLQYCFRNNGKNADITVMANAEFAQSYSAQEMTLVDCFDGIGKEDTVGVRVSVREERL